MLGLPQPVPKHEASQAAAPEVRSNQSTATPQLRQLVHGAGALQGQLENQTRLAASCIVNHYKNQGGKVGSLFPASG